MNKFAEIRYSLAQLSDVERKDIIAWLERFGERIHGFGMHGFESVEDSDGRRAASGVHFTESVSPDSPSSRSATPEYMTREQFLDFQEQSFTPFEFVNGIIRPMSGPSVAHCLITQNIHRVLDSRLRWWPVPVFLAPAVKST